MSEASNTPQLQIAWILFGAFIASHLLFAGIGVFMHGAVPDPDNQVAVLAAALGAVGLVELVAIFLVVPRAMGQAPYDTLFIIRAALAESLSIFGLLLAMMGAPLEWCAVFWGVGLSALSFIAPTEKDRAAFRGRRGSTTR